MSKLAQYLCPRCNTYVIPIAKEPQTRHEEWDPTLKRQQQITEDNMHCSSCQAFLYRHRVKAEDVKWSQTRKAESP